MKRTRVRRAVPVMEIRYEFGFDAAHRFPAMRRGHKYRAVHGHSFRVEVGLRGAPRAPGGFVTDFARLERACGRLRAKLDHTLLNASTRLRNPSLENLCLWIWERLAPRFPALARVTVRRDSLGQSCTYRGPSG